jgi:hypothetical protein
MNNHDTICDRCGGSVCFGTPDHQGQYGGHCPECEENLCWNCADWVQRGVDLICRACKNERDLPKGTYIPYHQYYHTFGEAVSLSLAKKTDRLSQAKWRALSLEQQETILAEWDNHETITKAWDRLTGGFRHFLRGRREGDIV